MKRAAKSAARVMSLENNDVISTETEAIKNRIRQRAFELSHTRPPDAHALFDWITAQSEIISVPPAELIEKEETFELKFALGGVNPEDVNVMVAPNHILLRSEFKHQHSNNGTVHLCDFKSAVVFRSVDLPQAIDVSSVRADFVDGTLLVRASKENAGQARPKRAERKRNNAQPRAAARARRTSAKKRQSTMP